MSGAQDHLAAFFALLQADAGLNPYDGEVPDAAPTRRSVVYFFVMTPDGLAAPDAVDLTFDSAVIDGRAYVHNIGETPSSARIQSDRVRAAVLNKTPAIAGRSCFPVRWMDSQPAQRNEEVPGSPSHDLVDVYGWRSVPG